jgi:hypothetical protein
MSYRFLVTGLAFFVALLALAVWPVLARGHTPNVNVPCTINGGEGPNYLVGTSGPDVICGRGGNDTITGQGGNAIIKGGDGNDRIQGDSGSDVLFGGAGTDYLWARDAAPRSRERRQRLRHGADRSVQGPRLLSRES